MLSRIGYAIKKCVKHASELRRYYNEPELQLSTIHDLRPQDLAVNDVHVLVLDYDGVLASHGELQPREDVILHLQNFNQYPIYVLSNKPMPERKIFFADNLPNVNFVMAKRKKPYPDGMQEIIRLSNTRPANILLVDDRLATGIVLALEAGVQARLITTPYTNLAKRPISELWFMFLRAIERFACK